MEVLKIGLQNKSQYDCDVFRGRIKYTEMYDMLRELEPPVGFGKKCPWRLAYRVSYYFVLLAGGLKAGWFVSATLQPHYNLWIQTTFHPPAAWSNL